MLGVGLGEREAPRGEAQARGPRTSATQDHAEQRAPLHTPWHLTGGFARQPPLAWMECGMPWVCGCGLSGDPMAPRLGSSPSPWGDGSLRS